MAASGSDELEETTPRMVVAFVDLQVLDELIDPLGQNRDLNLGRAGVLFVHPILVDDCGFLAFIQRHPALLLSLLQPPNADPSQSGTKMVVPRNLGWGTYAAAGELKTCTDFLAIIALAPVMRY